jgi:hypothetical protein
MPSAAVRCAGAARRVLPGRDVDSNNWIFVMRALRFLPLLALLLVPAAGRTSVAGVGALVLDDFNGKPAARFPDGWKSRTDAEEAARVYRVVAENGEQFLHATAEADSVQIGLAVSFRLEEYPLLSWRWRIAELPTGADEREAATNDSAAGVYVVFRGGFGGLLPRAIKYVWSAREPRGTAIPSPRYPNSKIVVLESGGEERGAWKVETVNVADDYRRLFQSDPPEPQGIAVLTDADNTQSRAVADYDDFRALAAGSPEALAPKTARQTP